MFAFLWTIYILLAVAGSVLWVARFSAVSSGSFSPAARIMLVVVAVGATILWPMVRLSQSSPRKGVMGHVLADAIIVLTPIQLILWPLIGLAGWPLSIIVAVACTMAAWVALAGGLLALGLSGPPATVPGDPALASRTLWMTIILAIVGAAPIATLALRVARTPPPVWLAMLSPITAIPQLTGVGMSGPQNPATRLEYQLIGATGAAALAAWLLASVRFALGNRPDPA